MTDDNDVVSNNTKAIKRNTRVGYIKAAFQGLLFSVVAWQTYQFAFADNSGKDKDHVAVIEIKGAISAGSRYGDGIKFGDTVDSIIANPNVKAVLIEANSPGGSPTQAEIMVAVLNKLVAEKPVVVSIGDLCASACLFALASNPDIPIYSHSSSMIGSVGVKIESWGVNKVLERFDIERRTYSIGDHKVFLDPFSAADADVESHIKKELLSPVFEQFKDIIRHGRGDKLSDDPNVFTGLMWVGPHAQELGLVDEIKTTYEIRQDLKEEYETSKFVYYNSQKRTFTEMLAVSISDTVIESISNDLGFKL